MAWNVLLTVCEVELSTQSYTAILEWSCHSLQLAWLGLTVNCEERG